MESIKKPVDDLLVSDSTSVTNEELFKTISTQSNVKVYTKDEHGFDLIVRYKLPTLNDRDVADQLYSRAYTKMLKDDSYMTIDEMLAAAKRRGLWSDADDKRLAEIDNDILETKDLANSETNKNKKKKLFEKLAELRNEKFQYALRLGRLTASAIENLAERERTIYMLLKCTFVIDENGNELPLYASKEEIENEQNLKMLERITLDGKSFWTGEGIADFLHFDA